MDAADMATSQMEVTPSSAAYRRCCSASHQPNRVTAVTGSLRWPQASWPPSHRHCCQFPLQRNPQKVTFGNWARLTLPVILADTVAMRRATT